MGSGAIIWHSHCTAVIKGPHGFRDPEYPSCNGSYCLRKSHSVMELMALGQTESTVNCSCISEMDSTVRRSITENNRQLQQFTIVIWRLRCFQLSYSKLYDTVFPWSDNGFHTVHPHGLWKMKFNLLDAKNLWNCQTVVFKETLRHYRCKSSSLAWSPRCGYGVLNVGTLDHAGPLLMKPLQKYLSSFPVTCIGPI